MQNIREQNSHEGLFLFNVPRGWVCGGSGAHETLKPELGALMKLTWRTEPGIFAQSAPESTLIMASASKETIPGVWAPLPWEIESHLYIQANSTALLRAESLLEK